MMLRESFFFFVNRRRFCLNYTHLLECHVLFTYRAHVSGPSLCIEISNSASAPLTVANPRGAPFSKATGHSKHDLLEGGINW